VPASEVVAAMILFDRKQGSLTQPDGSAASASPFDLISRPRAPDPEDRNLEREFPRQACHSRCRGQPIAFMVMVLSIMYVCMGSRALRCRQARAALLRLFLLGIDTSDPRGSIFLLHLLDSTFSLGLVILPRHWGWRKNC
jgi:hypothetical protein